MQIQQTGGKDNAGKAKHAIWKMAAESYRILCGIYCRRPAALLCTGQAAWIIRRNVFEFADVLHAVRADYLTLFVKIILTFIAAAKRREPDVSERSRGILFAVTALLLFANLSNAQTVSDLASGTIQGKGLEP